MRAVRDIPLGASTAQEAPTPKRTGLYGLAHEAWTKSRLVYALACNVADRLGAGSGEQVEKVTASDAGLLLLQILDRIQADLDGAMEELQRCLEYIGER